jgi:hypothetical protein
MGLVAYWLTLHSNTRFLEDALWYEYLGYRAADDWLSGRSAGLATLSDQGQAVWAMVVTVAALYYLMGGVRAVPVLLVLYSVVTAVVPVYTYYIGRELRMSERAARHSAWLVALSPAFVFWSGSLYKEGMILLVLAIAVYHTLRLQAGWSIRSLAMLVLAVGALFGLRVYLAAMMTIVVTAGLLLSRASEASSEAANRVPALVRQALVALAFVGVVVGLGLTESAERRLVETPEGVLVEVAKTRHWLAYSAGSGYAPEAEVSTPQAAAEYLPVGLFYFLTAPLPWQTGSLRQNLIIPETAFWLLLYPLIGMGFVRGLRLNRPATLVVLAATGGMCVIYGLVSGNVGIAYRMRSQVWLLWAPFAAWGWEVWRARREKMHQTRREVLKARAAARHRRIMGAGVE